MQVWAIHQEPRSTLDSLEPPIHARGHELVDWLAWRDPLPDGLADAGAVIVLGGTANPDQTDELPWLARERDVLASLVAAGTPVLGICLGAQLLAASLGAPVTRLPRPEIGWWPVTLAAEAASDPLLSALPTSFRAFEWHDYAFDLPSGATLLASSERAPNQAARVAERAWALQFHLEVSAETIASWMAGGTAELEAKHVSSRQLVADTDDEIASYAEHARQVSERFLELAEAHAAAPDSRPLS